MSGDDEIVEVVGPVEPKRLGTMQSVRLDGDLATALRDRANGQSIGISDLLRLGAEVVLAFSDEELDRALRCQACDGSGRRRWGRP